MGRLSRTVLLLAIDWNVSSCCRLLSCRSRSQAHLRGTDARGKDGPRDPDEAAYWLKRYVATTFGAEATRIALTQLGSSYADSARQPVDFGRARLAWELAGALGDPVAPCFLGAVHAQGLGTPADWATASQWYERATAMGANCPVAGPAVPPTNR